MITHICANEASQLQVSIELETLRSRVRCVTATTSCYLVERKFNDLGARASAEKFLEGKGSRKNKTEKYHH